MKNKRLVYIVFLVLFISTPLIVVAYSQQTPNPGHTEEEIIINIGGTDLTLKAAISGGSLIAPITTGSNCYTSLPFGHYGNEIWINVNGTEKTLQNAIDQGSLCCSNCAFSGYSQNPNTKNHLGTSILIKNASGAEKTLQEAISNKEFCNPCGEGICDSAHGETCSTCSIDCGICPPVLFCGDGVCNNGETRVSCPADCPCTAATSATSGTYYLTYGYQIYIYINNGGYLGLYDTFDGGYYALSVIRNHCTANGFRDVSLPGSCYYYSYCPWVCVC